MGEKGNMTEEEEGYTEENNTEELEEEENNTSQDEDTTATTTLTNTINNEINDTTDNDITLTNDTGETLPTNDNTEDVEEDLPTEEPTEEDIPFNDDEDTTYTTEEPTEEDNPTVEDIEDTNPTVIDVVDTPYDDSAVYTPQDVSDEDIDTTIETIEEEEEQILVLEDTEEEDYEELNIEEDIDSTTTPVEGTLTTSDEGDSTASVTIDTSDLDVGTYTAIIEYPGGDGQEPSIGTATITVVASDVVEGIVTLEGVPPEIKLGQTITLKVTAKTINGTIYTPESIELARYPLVVRVYPVNPLLTTPLRSNPYTELTESIYNEEDNSYTFTYTNTYATNEVYIRAVLGCPNKYYDDYQDSESEPFDPMLSLLSEGMFYGAYSELYTMQFMKQTPNIDIKTNTGISSETELYLTPDTDISYTLKAVDEYNNNLQELPIYALIDGVDYSTITTDTTGTGTLTVNLPLGDHALQLYSLENDILFEAGSKTYNLHCGTVNCDLRLTFDKTVFSSGSQVGLVGFLYELESGDTLSGESVNILAIPDVDTTQTLQLGTITTEIAPWQVEYQYISLTDPETGTALMGGYNIYATYDGKPLTEDADGNVTEYQYTATRSSNHHITIKQNTHITLTELQTMTTTANGVYGVLLEEENGNGDTEPLTGTEFTLHLNNTVINCVTDSNGEFTYTCEPLPAGTYTLQAVYSGETYKNGCNSNTLTIDVGSEVQITTLTDKTTYLIGDTMQYTIQLTDTNNNPLSDETVTLHIDNITIDGITDTNGEVTGTKTLESLGTFTVYSSYPTTMKYKTKNSTTQSIKVKEVLPEFDWYNTNNWPTITGYQPPTITDTTIDINATYSNRCYYNKYNMEELRDLTITYTVNKNARDGRYFAGILNPTTRNHIGIFCENTSMFNGSKNGPGNSETGYIKDQKGLSFQDTITIWFDDSNMYVHYTVTQGDDKGNYITETIPLGGADLSGYYFGTMDHQNWGLTLSDFEVE